MTTALNPSAATAIAASATTDASARAASTSSRLHVVRFAGAAAVAWIAWGAATGMYSPGSAFGYALGVTGASMMVVLLLYPLRKRSAWLKRCGALKYWFAMHMMCGIAGPLLILLHSTLRARSVNAAVALSCMILVAVSGLLGRFIYRKIHHGLYGARARLDELERALVAELGSVERVLQPVPAVQAEIERYAALARQAPKRWHTRLRRFVVLGPARWFAERRVAHAIALVAPEHSVPARRQLATLAARAGDTLRAMQRVAQFRAYERLFSLWHVLHIPFVFMLVVSAVVHVVAVHMY